MKAHNLIQRYLLGTLSEDETRKLDQLLADDADLRREFVLAASVDVGIREAAFERAVDTIQNETVTETSATKLGPALWGLGMLVAGAASMLVALNAWLARPGTVATLASSENAAWESELPTTTGSRLSAGLLNLKSGIATVRFDSGAEVVLEAPAKLELLTPMRGRLHSGAIFMDVPKPAIGFVLETPDGYAVDYGTQFAVRVDRAGNRSDFEIIEGEIAVHHAQSGEEVRLIGEGKTATISEETLAVGDVLLEEDAIVESSNVIRIGTHGRSGSVLRNNKRAKHISPELLSVKKTNKGKWDHRSFFAFDLRQVDLVRVDSARLRLNLVPSTRGQVTRLPQINRFSIYGLTNDAKANWRIDTSWEDAPGPEDGILLGSFEIERSQSRGSFGIKNAELLKFLRANQNGSVTLILVRDTTQLEGVGPGMMHAFASDSHPESVGPMLEFALTEKRADD